MNKTWRFKTKEEFKRDGLWIDSKGIPQGWNKSGNMNYLLGKELIPEVHHLCERGETFKYDEWKITSDHYTSVIIDSQSATTIRPQQPQAFTPPNSQYQAGPNFDINRLAKEIDEMFQKKINEATSRHTNISDSALKRAKSDMDKYQQDVQKTFKDIREQLLAEVTRGHTTIVLPDQMQINIQHMDHPKMVDVIKSLNMQKKAMLVGPAGTGKTFMVAAIAERMKLPFYKYSCSRDSSVHDLIGYKQPTSETYLETTFLNAYENGGIFLVDEYDAMSGDMSLFFNGVADSSKFISIPHRDAKPIAKKHKDFYLIMCGNTWGKGSVDYSGRDFQDMALMDRFRLCRHFIDYHIALERQWMGNEYPFAEMLRKALESSGNYLSTRNIEDIANLMRTNVSRKEIAEMLAQDLDDEGRKNVIAATGKFERDNPLTRIRAEQWR